LNNLQTLPLDQITIIDQDVYERCGIRWLPAALRLVHANGVKARVLSSTPGLARILNLVAWQPSGDLEYLDEASLCSDQLIHSAWDQCIHQKFGSDYVGYRLLGEVLASSSDLYLLGRLANCGETPDFVQETLESFNFYFETYSDLGELERLLTEILADPYQQMLNLARYLYRFAWLLITENEETATVEGLDELATHPFYPLTHHYHLPNWIVTLGNKHQTHSEHDRIIESFWNVLAEGDQVFETLSRGTL